MERPEPGEVLVWSVRPVSLERAKGAGAAGAVLAASAGAAAFGGPVMGGLALLVLGGAVGPFFVRTRYRLTAEAVEVRSPFLRVRRPWTAFRRSHVGRLGVSLSPFTGNHLLEPYRSVLLVYGSRREEILDWVRRFGPGGESPA